VRKTWSEEASVSVFQEWLSPDKSVTEGQSAQCCLSVNGCHIFMNTSGRLIYTAGLLMRVELVSLSLILSLRARACVCVCVCVCAGGRSGTCARNHDRQCGYNITLRRDPATIDAVKNNKYYILWLYVCRLGYPSWSAHAPYCHPLPARLYNISPHFLINGTDFGKKKLLK